MDGRSLRSLFARCDTVYQCGVTVLQLLCSYAPVRELLFTSCVPMPLCVRLLQVYGPTAWWWEVEELIRKLLLSAVVVLIESGSPLQAGPPTPASLL